MYLFFLLSHDTVFKNFYWFVHTIMAISEFVYMHVFFKNIFLVNLCYTAWQIYFFCTAMLFWFFFVAFFSWFLEVFFCLCSTGKEGLGLLDTKRPRRQKCSLWRGLVSDRKTFTGGWLSQRSNRLLEPAPELMAASYWHPNFKEILVQGICLSPLNLLLNERFSPQM